jgi:hypothetical protein
MKEKRIDYYKLRDELKEATYHIGAPLSYTHGSCAKMFFTYMDYLAGEITWDECVKILKEIHRVIDMTEGCST